MNVCIISREYPPFNQVGGIATYSATAASILADNNYEVHVITSGQDNNVYREKNITIHQLKMLPHHFENMPYLYRKYFRKWLPTYLDALTWARTVGNYAKNLLLTKKFDRIEYPETMGEGSLVPVSNNSYTVCRIHSSSLGSLIKNPFERFMIKRLQKKSCNKADKVVSPSKFVITNYAKKYLNLKREVILNRNPMVKWDTSINWENKKYENLLFVGRIEHRKGIQFLLKAFNELKLDYPKLTLKIIGACHPPLSEKDRQCQLELKGFLEKFPKKFVQYFPSQNHTQIHKHYDAAGLFILPSLVENYPYVALEALSRGCFVIGSDAGGIPEIIYTKNRGLLFDSGNKEDLKSKIRWSLENKKFIQKVARKNVTEFECEYTDKNNFETLKQNFEID